MVLIMKVSQNSPDYELLFDNIDTAIAYMKRHKGEQEREWAIAYSSMMEKRYSWKEYEKKYAFRSQICVVYIEPNLIITPEKIFDEAL